MGRGCASAVGEEEEEKVERGRVDVDVLRQAEAVSNHPVGRDDSGAPGDPLAHPAG